MALIFDADYYEKIRKELLDLRNNNPLLNFNFNRALTIVDELPNQIFEELSKEKVFYAIQNISLIEFRWCKKPLAKRKY